MDDGTGPQRKHAGRTVTNPMKLSRMIQRVDSTGKPRLVQIMRELEPGLTKREAEKSYDRVTAAINGWMIAYTKDLPVGLHARLLLANCFSLNLCWIRSAKPDVYPNHPALWVQVGDRRGKPGPRAYLRRLRKRAWSQWYSQHRTPGQIPPEGI